MNGTHDHEHEDKELIIRLPLDHAIASILGKKDHEGYRDIGQNMKNKDLYTILGVTSPMLYHYLSGHTTKIEPERALVLLDKFDVLINDWQDRDDLERDATNAELSDAIAKAPTNEIMDKLVELDENASDNHQRLRRGVRKLIAKYY